MKIALVGYFETQFYGSMAKWVSNAFSLNGHEVIEIDRKNIVIPEDTDIVFFEDCSEDFSANIPDNIKQPKVCWLLDIHMPLGTERSVNIARKCDLVFCMNMEYGVKLLEKFGIKSYWMPSTYDETLTNYYLRNPFGKMNELRNKPKVCMIGHPNSPERLKLWEIIKEYDEYAVTGKIETEKQYVEAMNSCSIVINQPTEPWDIITGIRFFEALGFGKLCLQKKIRTNELEKLGFEDGKDFIYWYNFDDLKEKLEYWTKPGRQNTKEYKAIVESGHKKVQKMSMTAQAAKIEQIILSLFYDRL